MSTEEYEQLLEKAGGISLATLYGEPRKRASLYCIVKGTEGVDQCTAGDRDFRKTFHAEDPTHYSSGRSFFFNRDEKVLLDICDNMIMVLKDAPIRLYKGVPQISPKEARTKVVFFKPESNEPIQYNYHPCLLNKTDMKVVTYLQNWLSKQSDEQSDDIDIVPIPRPSVRKLVETKDIMEDKHPYMNFVGQIVDIEEDDVLALDSMTTTLKLYLTDYTRNPKPGFIGNHEDKHVGYEYMILCTLWGRHVQDGANLECGDYVYLDNCKKKCQSTVELNIQGDNESKKKVKKLDPSATYLRALLERKEQHSSSMQIQAVSREENFKETTLQTQLAKMIPQKRTQEQARACSLRTSLMAGLGEKTSIQNILKQKATGQYFTSFYIKEYKPSDIKKWIIGRCALCRKTVAAGAPCTQCQKSTVPGYQFALLARDPLSNAELILQNYGYDASCLLAAVSAEEVSTDAKALNRLQSMIDYACSDQHTLDFQVESYRKEGKQNLHYKIVNTEFFFD